MTFDEKRGLVDKVRTREFAFRAAELAALEEKYGPGVAKTAMRAKAGLVELEWREIAKTCAGGIQGLADTLWKGMEDSGFRFTSERVEKGMRFTVTRCPLAEMAVRLGQAKWGYLCYCMDYPSIVKGFDPAMRYSRTKTLMQGQDCCDHCFTE